MNETSKKKIDFILTAIVFALTGLSAAFLSGMFMNVLGVEPWTILYMLGYLFFLLPLYQGLSLVYAFLFGKFNWFYSGQKIIVEKTVEKFNRIKTNYF